MNTTYSPSALNLLNAIVARINMITNSPLKTYENVDGAPYSVTTIRAAMKGM